VNFGKPEEWILKKNKPGNGCKKTFSRFDFPEKNKRKKTNANLFSLKLQENSYWFCLSSSCLYNKQSTTPLPKIILYTTLIVFFHYTQQFFCYFFKVFLYLSNSPIKYCSDRKKNLERKILPNKGTAFPKRDLCC